MKGPGDPVTTACYGEGSGDQARWHFNNKISKGVRKRDKGWKRNRERTVPPRWLQNFYPITRFSSHIISLQTVDFFMRCIYEILLIILMSGVLWGKGREEVTSIRHITGSWGSDCIRYLPFCSTSILSIGRKIKSARKKEKRLK